MVTARAGTPLAELEAALAERGQCLPFEPPRFAGAGSIGGTVGGMVAAGLAGPARATVGSVRDYVLGATLLNGQGELMSFGGQVMKNVAGYDVSRLLAGSMGVLGVVCEVSLKVLPRPVALHTLRFECTEEEALRRLNFEVDEVYDADYRALTRAIREFGIKAAQRHPRLGPDARAVVEHLNGLELSANIDEDSVGDRLAGQAGATGTQCQRDSVTSTYREQPTHLGGVASSDHNLGCQQEM